MPLIHIGLMVGSFYMLILMLLRSSLEEGLKWLLWVVIATNLLFLPKGFMILSQIPEQRLIMSPLP